MTLQKNKPALRFKEFKNEWQKFFISDLFNISAGGDIDSKHVSSVETETYKYPIYANAEKEKGLYGYSDVYKIEGEAITIAGRGVNIGIAHARHTPFYPIVRLLVLKPRFQASIRFYEYALNRLNIVSESTGVPQLTAPQISKYRLQSTSFDEQQKIASFLTAVDDKIQQLTKKKARLEQYKKGIMQKLFSQELRFKDDDGNDYPDWEEKTLSEVAMKISSNIAANTIENNNGIYPIYGATGFLKHVDFYKQENAYISIVKDGAGVGRLLICEGKSSVLGTLDIIQPNNDLNTYYLYSSLQRIDFDKYKVGSTIPHIYFKDYSNETIPIPTKQEQQKIADFLTSIDEKINSIETYKEQTQQFKKGLLQQMFV